MEKCGSIEIEFAGHALRLLPDRAIWWAARMTLLVADAHLGKGAAFRSAGLPVPTGSTAKDLSRLSSLLNETGAARLVILGDLLHAKSGRPPEILDAIARWRASHAAVRMLLVRGNHDRAAGRIPADWQMDEVEEPFDDAGVTLLHDPPCDPAHPTFAGHLHPTVSLSDFDGSTVTAPCFVFDNHCAILPAFGTFTGGHTIRPQSGRRLFVVAAGRVIPLSTPSTSRV